MTPAELLHSVIAAVEAEGVRLRAEFYGIYEDAHRPFELSAEADQGIAGAIMMIEGSLVTIAVLAWLFLRLAQEGELRQELLECGLDPRSVRRAVRYGRGQELSRTS